MRTTQLKAVLARYRQKAMLIFLSGAQAIDLIFTTFSRSAKNHVNWSRWHARAAMEVHDEYWRRRKWIDAFIGSV